jgi:hypothetical protein
MRSFETWFNLIRTTLQPADVPRLEGQLNGLHKTRFIAATPLPSQPIPKAKVLHHLDSAAAPKAAKADIVANFNRALDGRWDHNHMITHA